MNFYLLQLVGKWISMLALLVLSLFNYNVENEEYVFIDYLTTIPNISSKVVYYRIILQDISQLGSELTDEELAILPDNLPELLDILGITENIELPVKIVEDDLEE